jgi:hypothetical protein
VAEQIEWSVYTATEAEVATLWRLVQESLSLLSMPEPQAEEQMEVA